MTHKLPSVYLLRADGNVEVSCENSWRKTRPCNERVKLTPDGVGLTGLVIYFESGRGRYLCSWKCAESYAKRVK
jgi:hypothetical protein